MPLYKITVNGAERSVEAVPDMPLLWVLRDLLGLTGSKYGCGIGACGVCTVLLDGDQEQSCQVPISTVGKKKVTTIEGFRRTARTRCRRLGSSTTCPNVAIARRGRSWRRRRC